MNPLGRAAALSIWGALALIWGSTWLFIKVGLEDLPPFSFAGIRFAVALVPLAALMALRRARLPRRPADWALLTFTGLFSFAGSYGLVFWGEQFISSGLTALLFATFPFFGLLLAHALLPSEPLRPRKIAGVLLGIVGVAVIFADQLKLEGRMALWGAAAVLGSAVVSALSGVLIKGWGGHLDPVAVSVSQMAIGGLPLLILGLALEGNPLRLAWTPKAVFCLLYLAFVGTSLAFVLWYRLLQATEVTRAQAMPFFNTVVAVILGCLVLDESYGLKGALGGIAVLLGLGLTLGAPAEPSGPAKR